MKKVTCINDKNQPTGACVIKGTEYEVETEYVNALDQRVYIIVGVPNEGITKFGMRWVGYDALRFTENESVSSSMSEYSFALN